MTDNFIPIAVEEIKHAIDGNLQLQEFNELQHYIVEMKKDLDAVSDLSMELEGKDSKEDAPLKMISTMQSALATAQLLDATISAAYAASSSSGQGSQGLSNQASWVKSTLIPWLQKLLSKVWAKILKLVTPTQWSVSGGVGVSVLGLANVELSVTFG